MLEFNEAMEQVIVWASSRRLWFQTSQPCEEMLRYCKFSGKIEACLELFSSVLTDEGLCCTFNSLDPSLLYTLGRLDLYFLLETSRVAREF